MGSAMKQNGPSLERRREGVRARIGFDRCADAKVGRKDVEGERTKRQGLAWASSQKSDEW